MCSITRMRLSRKPVAMNSLRWKISKEAVSELMNRARFYVIFTYLHIFFLKFMNANLNLIFIGKFL